MFKRILSAALICILLSLMSPIAGAYTILPGKTDVIKQECGSDCDITEYCNETIDFLFSQAGSGSVSSWVASNTDPEFTESILYCGIVSGNIQLWMIPFYIRGALQFLLSIAGLISVLMIIIGAYYYIAGGISDDKEKGKTIIKYALGGLVLSTLAWFIVNIILLIVTS